MLHNANDKCKHLLRLFRKFWVRHTAIAGLKIKPEKYLATAISRTWRMFLTVGNSRAKKQGPWKFSMIFSWSSIKWNFHFFQKHPSKYVLIKRCSKNMQQSYRNTRMPKSSPPNGRFYLLITLQTSSHPLLIDLNSLDCIPSVLPAVTFQLILLCSSHRFMAIQIFYLNIWIYLKSSTEISIL